MVNIIRRVLLFRWWLALLLVLGLIGRGWTISGYNSVFIDTDLGRDLKEISNIQAGSVVWLGPWLGPGLHASSSYYYLFYPGVALSGGQISSLITFNLLIAMSALGGLGILATKKYGVGGVLLTGVMGLLPMVTANVLHPGNGYTYIFFILICLASLWFSLPLMAASAAAGMALALHPASGFLPILLLLEWWRRGHQIKSAIINAVVFALPLAPLIAFEVITKGFVIRSFLARPSTNGIQLQLTLGNISLLSDLLGLPIWAWLGLLGLTGWLVWKMKDTQTSSWFSLSMGLIGMTLLLQNVLGRYLFGVALLSIFVISIVLVQKKWGQLLLALVLISLWLQSPFFKPHLEVERNASWLEHMANEVQTIQTIDPDKKIAVVAVMTENTEVPQADDYRFLLRNRGYTVVETTEHHLAEQLVMIVEVPGFDWQHWSTWEVESFGEKTLRNVTKIKNTQVIVFDRVK